MRKKGFWLALLAPLLLAACGGGGSAGTTSVNLSGTAAKGLLAGASVQAYEVVSGELRALGAPSVTDAHGAYSLDLPPTDNPVIVKVTATAQTTMLDETGQLVDGKFPQIPAPVGLELRTIVESLRAAAVAHANPLTGMAVDSATTITDAQGRPVPPTADTVAQAKALLSQSLSGLDPFNTRPLAGTAETGSLDQIKLTQLLAGVVKDSQTRAACPGDSTGLTCNLPKGPQLVLGADNKVSASNTTDVATRLVDIGRAGNAVNNEFAQKNALFTLEIAGCSSIETKAASLFSNTFNAPDGSRVDVYAFGRGASSTNTAAAEVRLSGPLATKVLASATARTYCKAREQQADCTIPPGYLLIPALPDSITNDRWYTEQVQAAIAQLPSGSGPVIAGSELNLDILLSLMNKPTPPTAPAPSTGGISPANTASLSNRGRSIGVTAPRRGSVTLANTAYASISGGAISLTNPSSSDITVTGSPLLNGGLVNVAEVSGGNIAATGGSLVVISGSLSLTGSSGGNLTTTNTSATTISSGAISLTNSSNGNYTISNTGSLSASSPSIPTFGTGNITGVTIGALSTGSVTAIAGLGSCGPASSSGSSLGQ